jgi:hypothetical protein
MNARFDSICKVCRKKVKEGLKMFYDPRTKKAYCRKCGRYLEKYLRNMAEVENYYSGRG